MNDNIMRNGLTAGLGYILAAIVARSESETIRMPISDVEIFAGGAKVLVMIEKEAEEIVLTLATEDQAAKKMAELQAAITKMNQRAHQAAGNA